MLGRTDFFVAKIKDPNDFGPTTNETESTKWMTEKQFMMTGRTLHKAVIRSAIKIIKQRIRNERKKVAAP